MTYSKAQFVSKYYFNINSEILHQILGPIKDQNQDLGIFVDAKLKYDSHIDKIVNRSNKLLGFTHRNCADCND